MSDEITTKIGEINSAFEEFKTTINNNEKARDVLLEEKTDRINADLTKIQHDITEMQKKAGRVATDAGEEVEAEHRSLFNDYVRNGENERELKAFEQKNSLTISGNSGNNGGKTVPVVVDMNINQTLVNLGAVRGLARVITTSTGNYSILRNDRGTASAWVAETASRAETASPVITQIAVPGGEIYANIAATQQLLDDSAIDMEAYIADEASAAFAVKEADAFLNGDGTNKPLGLLASSLQTVSTAALNADALLDMIHKVKAGYRSGAAFIAPTLQVAAFRKLKDTTGAYIWSPPTADRPAAVHGYSLLEDEAMPAAAEDTVGGVLFGNFGQYLITDRKGITLIRDPYSNKPYVMFYMTKRVGGHVVDPAAFCTYTLNAA